MISAASPPNAIAAMQHIVERAQVGFEHELSGRRLRVEFLPGALDLGMSVNDIKNAVGGPQGVEARMRDTGLGQHALATAARLMGFYFGPYDIGDDGYTSTEDQVAVVELANEQHGDQMVANHGLLDAGSDAYLFGHEAIHLLMGQQHIADLYQHKDPYLEIHRVAHQDVMAGIPHTDGAHLHLDPQGIYYLHRNRARAPVWDITNHQLWAGPPNIEQRILQLFDVHRHALGPLLSGCVPVGHKNWAVKWQHGAISASADREAQLITGDAFKQWSATFTNATLVPPVRSIALEF